MAPDHAHDVRRGEHPAEGGASSGAPHAKSTAPTDDVNVTAPVLGSTETVKVPTALSTASTTCKRSPRAKLDVPGIGGAAVPRGPCAPRCSGLVQRRAGRRAVGDRDRGNPNASRVRRPYKRRRERAADHERVAEGHGPAPTTGRRGPAGQVSHAALSRAAARCYPTAHGATRPDSPRRRVPGPAAAATPLTLFSGGASDAEYRWLSVPRGPGRRGAWPNPVTAARSPVRRRAGARRSMRRGPRPSWRR